MTRIREEDYAYATARVRAVEIRLLDAARLDRLVEAPTAEDAVKQLSEAGYGDGQDLTRTDWETVLDGEPVRVHAYLAGFMPQPEVLDVFRTRDDYLNLKRLMKATFQAQDLSTVRCVPGTVPAAVLVRALTERRVTDLPPVMGAAMLEAMDEYGKRADPRDIDLVLDRACFRQMADMAAVWENEFLTGLVAHMTDMANIRIAIRGKLVGEGEAFFGKALLAGGFIPPDRLRGIPERSMDALLESLRLTYFGEAAIAGYEGYRQGRGMSWLERLLDDRLMVYIRQARHVTMGVEALVGYLLARESEIRNVRIIMTGKTNGLPQAQIRERLRLAYV